MRERVKVLGTEGVMEGKEGGKEKKERCKRRKEESCGGG